MWLFSQILGPLHEWPHNKSLILLGLVFEPLICVNSYVSFGSQGSAFGGCRIMVQCVGGLSDETGWCTSADLAFVLSRHVVNVPKSSTFGCISHSIAGCASHEFGQCTPKPTSSLVHVKKRSSTSFQQSYSTM